MLNKLIKDDNVINVYRYGSQVYGKTNIKSDNDFIVIVEDLAYSYDQIEENNNHFNIYRKSDWEEMKNNNNIVVLECMSLPDKDIIKGEIDYIDIDKVKVRKEISRVSGNAYVKCKKKLIEGVDYSPYIAKKSLWHSLRVLMYGIQIVKYGRVVDFTEANIYYEEIVYNENNNWDYFNSTWKKEYNRLRSIFRKETAEEWECYKRSQI